MRAFPVLPALLLAQWVYHFWGCRKMPEKLSLYLNLLSLCAPHSCKLHCLEPNQAHTKKKRISQLIQFFWLDNQAAKYMQINLELHREVKLSSNMRPLHDYVDMKFL